MRHKILVIDDDEKITSMLKRSLAFEGYSVATAPNGQTGIQMFASDEPDLLVLDLMMPIIDGWEVCKRIRAAGSKTPILMLTARDEVQDRVKGLDSGADDYLVKPFALEELLARVRALLRRNVSKDDRQHILLRYADLVVDVDARAVTRGGRRIELTTKEFELLLLFMQNPNRVLSRDYIMDKIWGFDYSGESNVLEVYVATLRQKTEDFTHVRLIQTIRGVGYVLRGEQV